MRDRIPPARLTPLTPVLVRIGWVWALAAAGPLMAADTPTGTPNLTLSRTLESPAPASSPPATEPRVIESTPATVRLLPLEISVNGASVGSWVLLERNGTLYAPAEAFVEWRVNRRAAAIPFTHQGVPWYPLSAVPGFDAQLNFANQSVDLKFQPQAFAATRLAQPVADRPPLTPASPASSPTTTSATPTPSSATQAPPNRI